MREEYDRVRRTVLMENLEFIADPAKEDKKLHPVAREAWAFTSPATRLSIADYILIDAFIRSWNQFERLFIAYSPDRSIQTFMDLQQTKILSLLYISASKDGFFMDRLTSDRKRIEVEEQGEKAPKGGIAGRIISKVKGGG